MAAYQTVNKNAQIFARPTRIVSMMNMRRTERVNTNEVRRNMPTIEMDRAELDKLLAICKD